MIRFLMALVAVSLFAGQVSAQLFPNAPWNRGSKAAQFSGNSCPGGVCPVPGQGIMRLDASQDARPGHWSYPGSIDSHLELAHGVSTQGLSRQEKLNIHDSLHEGVPQPIPPLITSMSYADASYAAPVVTAKTYGSTGSAVSYGSCGSSLRVGGRDHDGAVISSIGSQVSPEIAKAGTGTIETLAIGDRSKFRRTLLAAARQARQAGDITAAQFFMLSAASRNPAALDKMQAAVHEAAIEEGLATAQAIDWDSLLDFIEKLIPIIIQLIDLFS